MLELYAVKVARTVLRRGSDREVAFLSDDNVILYLTLRKANLQSDRQIAVEPLIQALLLEAL